MAEATWLLGFPDPS